nr:transposase (putative), gypsy type [Tanacetum cinerariifolium]
RFFWVDECVFPTAVEWRTNASKDGMPGNGTYSVEAVRALDTHRTPIQKKPEMLLCLVEMDLFSLIRAPNPTKVKTGSRLRAPHELPLLTLTAPRVIEMDEPSALTDSSGVPSTIERSPFDFAHESEASGTETAAPEMPSTEEVPITTAPGTDQAMETVVVKPHALLLTLRHPILLMLPSVAVAGDPKSENVSSPAEVGSPGSVYRPEWGVTNGSLLDTPKACQDLVDHATPPGGSLRPKNPRSGVKNKEPGSVVGDRGMYEEGCRREECWAESRIGKNACPVLGTSELERMRAQFLELQVSNKCLSQQVDALQQQVSREETLKAAFEDYKRQQDQMVEQRCAKIDARLDAMSIDFDEELYPHMLIAIAGRKWVIGHGLRLATMKCAESLEMRQAFADVVSAGIAKGMSGGLKHGVEHGHA